MALTFAVVQGSNSYGGDVVGLLVVVAIVVGPALVVSSRGSVRAPSVLTVSVSPREAVRRAGFEPKIQSVRGGTDGSRLSEMGLPTPNIFPGGHDLHARHEWICVADMGAAVATIVHLAQVWAEETTKGEKTP